MLQFKFIQPSEFDDPFYMLTLGEEDVAKIIFNQGEWVLDRIYENFCLTSGALLDISAKLKQLNEAL